MMNRHHMPAGQGQQHYQPAPNMHPHHTQQRPREFHPYPVAPQSPMHHYPYSPSYHPHPQQYYYPAAQSYPHQQQRWQQPPPYGQHYMPPPHSPIQHMPYQPRSPMVVSSQPQYNAQPHTPTARYPPSNPPFFPNPALQHRGSVQSPTSPVHLQSVEATPSRPTSVAGVSDERSALASAPQGVQSRSHSVNANSEVEEIETTSTKDPIVVNPLQASPVLRTPFYPVLPWYSPTTSATNFPPRDLARRKRRSTLMPMNDAVTLPLRTTDTDDVPVLSDAAKQSRVADDVASEVSTLAAPSDAETPATSHAPSESEFTTVSTPTTPAQIPDSSPKITPVKTNPSRRDNRSVVAVPIIPGLPRTKGTPTSVERQSPDVRSPHETSEAVAVTNVADDEDQGSVPEGDSTLAPKPAAPKSWADLVRKKEVPGTVAASTQANGVSTVHKNATLAEALRQYVVQPGRVTFFEPKGLVNTGNMCYMNSILQVLVFCVPFYDFLDQVRSRTVYSIKSDTPLLDAMIMFMRELPVLAAAPTAEALRQTLKPDQLEKFGESITPEYIYDAIKHLPRFQSMRRGHQQDAEEFLGFVLEGLHDECLAVMQSEEAQAVHSQEETVRPAGEADGWLEVGPKQKAAVTRTAGQQDAPSPVTKIFGGHLRSELRVSGQKDSITLEPYKPLQLDIGAAHIHNIVDAIKSITRPESLTGDFGGRINTAKKQVFIDSLPPVLILHLKRFQYENNLTGTQKIWKKIGYPLELEIPKEVFSPSKRGGLTVNNGLPKYRLTSVVYHHGKSAAGGHYTVDVLRQDLQEWVRIDDTYIRRIRAEDVAEGGSEEDPKVLARALEQHKASQDLQKQRNMYEGLDEADQPDEQTRPWNEVNGSGEKKSKHPVSAGLATPVTPNARKEGVRDNKIAYILLYERI